MIRVTIKVTLIFEVLDMKLWLYYIKLKNLTPSLYAFTNNKQYHKKFEKERNDELFIVKEKEVSKKDYYDFCNKHRGLNLVPTLFETYKDTDDSYIREIVEMICTFNEESSVHLNYEYINKEIAKSTSEVATTFNSEIVKALNDLYYFDFLKQKMYSNEYKNVLEYNRTYLDGIDDIPSGYSYDYLAIFIKMYGYTLKV